MNTFILEHSENAETALARSRRRIVGIIFMVLPLLVSFAYGMWSETARPWINPMDVDDTLMPLPAFSERCLSALFRISLLFVMPMAIGGLALFRHRTSITSMAFCAMALTVFEAMLAGMFIFISFAPGAPIPEQFMGLNGLLLFVLAPTALLSSLLPALSRGLFARICALLPSAMFGCVLLLFAISSRLH